jgi:type IV pilus assembly protein PilN
MTIEINLLPWRDARREARRRRWRGMLLGSVLLGLALGYALDIHYAARLDAQNSRLAMIERHMQALQPSLQARAEVQARLDVLDQRLVALRARLGQRGRGLALFNGLAATLMEGVTYTRLEQREDRLVLRGVAASHQHIAAQLESLRASSVFRAPSLSLVAPQASGWRFQFSVALAEGRS